MIQEVTNVLLLPQILPLAEHIPDTNMEALERMLREGLSSPDSKILIDKKDDNIRAFLFASLEEFRGEDVVFIQACYIDPQHQNIGKELITRLKHWCREKKIKKIVAITARSYKGFMRKYHFKIRSCVLEQEV